MAAASRFFDWFWLRSAERAARAGVTKPIGRALELLERAAAAAEAAARIERPAEPFVNRGNEAIAAELYRQSIHWALLAHAELRTPEAEPAPAADLPLPALLEQTEPALLRDAAGSDEELRALRPRLAESYREYAELSAEARRPLVAELARFARGLMDPVLRIRKKLERIRERRVLHVLGVLVLFAAAGLTARSVAAARREASDLAPRARWTTSSHYPGGCASPEQTCPGNQGYFFHTQIEADPWIVFDLGKERRISSVEVTNRRDCCFERALPLVLEVSSDRTHFTEVRRRTEEFVTTRFELKSVKVRYVRLRIPTKSGILHLSRVRIYP